MDPVVGISGVYDQFSNLVVVEVDRCKHIALDYLKDGPNVVATVGATVGGGGRTVSSSAGFSTSKRDMVMLLKFRGKEKTAYLQYSVWKKTNI